MTLKSSPLPFTIPQALAGILSLNGTGDDPGNGNMKLKTILSPFISPICSGSPGQAPEDDKF